MLRVLTPCKGKRWYRLRAKLLNAYPHETVTTIVKYTDKEKFEQDCMKAKSVQAHKST